MNKALFLYLVWIPSQAVSTEEALSKELAPIFSEIFIRILEANPRMCLG
jgi:hypothetical protein